MMGIHRTDSEAFYNDPNNWLVGVLLPNRTPQDTCVFVEVAPYGGQTTFHYEFKTRDEVVKYLEEKWGPMEVKDGQQQ